MNTVPSSQNHFDQEWTVRFKTSLKHPDEFLDGFDPSCVNAETSREAHPIDGRAVETQHVDCALARLLDADGSEFVSEHGVGPVRPYTRQNLQVLPGLRPQALHGVQRAAVRLERDNLSVRAGDRGADGERYPKADCAACQL